MPYNLSTINERIQLDTVEFVAECDMGYNKKIEVAANYICGNLQRSPIVLLSGPSGSGKTTTAIKIEEELTRRGIGCHSIALDNYYKNIGDRTPKTPDGEPDLEAPECQDLELLNHHFELLSRGEAIEIPKYDFSQQRRSDEPSKLLKLGKDEIAVFEGIHALNDIITSVHPEAFKLYISARSNVLNDGDVVFKGTWMRLVRRVVRDSLFRGAHPGYTMELWANVRRGEKNFISPFKDKANLKLDSSLPYEVSVMKTRAPELILTVPSGAERFAEIRSIVPAFDRFLPIDENLVAKNSLIREFIGGGIYDS